MAKNHTILSLDLGSTTGWAFYSGGVIRKSGVVSLKRDANDKPGTRFLKFYNWLNKFSTIKEIVYEDVPRFESGASAKVYCGLLALVQMHCLAHGIRMTCIKAKTVKKEFSGNGNADKGLICKVAHKLGWCGGKSNTQDGHDEADAVAIMWVTLNRRNVVPEIMPK